MTRTRPLNISLSTPTDASLTANCMFSRLTVAYEEDGVTPTTRKFYNAYGSCLQTQRYNKKTDTWS